MINLSKLLCRTILIQNNVSVSYHNSCYMSGPGSPNLDPLGYLIHEPELWGHKHRVDVFSNVMAIL